MAAHGFFLVNASELVDGQTSPRVEIIILCLPVLTGSHFVQSALFIKCWLGAYPIFAFVKDYSMPYNGQRLRTWVPIAQVLPKER